MQGNYFLLVLVVSYSQNIASSHILTSFSEMSSPACQSMLTYTVMNDLCPTYGDYSSEDIQPPIPDELALLKQKRKEIILEKCCTKPCTLNELLELC